MKQKRCTELQIPHSNSQRLELFRKLLQMSVLTVRPSERESNDEI